MALQAEKLGVQHIDFAMNQIVVPDGKRAKDRVTLLPAVAKEPITQHLQSVKRRHQAGHQADLSRGAGWVELPWALDRKYSNAGRGRPPPTSSEMGAPSAPFKNCSATTT